MTGGEGVHFRQEAPTFAGPTSPRSAPLPVTPNEAPSAMPRKSTLHEVICLLVEDNRFTPEDLEHAVWAAEQGAIDLRGRDESDAPIQRAARWRGKSPMVLPMLSGSRRGMPAPWTRWLLSQPQEVPDEALRKGLRVAAFSVTDLGSSTDRATAVLDYVVRSRCGEKMPASGHEWQVYQDYYKSQQRVQQQAVPTREVKGRVRVPPPPPLLDDRRRARGRPPRGSAPGDTGLLRYLPGYIEWLRGLQQPYHGASATVRALLSALPSLTVIPTAEELAEAARLRRGKIKSRGAVWAWEGFRIYAGTARVFLPTLSDKQIQRWKAPQPVALATRRLVGPVASSYRGLQKILRQDVLGGTRFPSGYTNGIFSAFRELNRAEKAWVQEILAWVPGARPEDPLFPVDPQTMKGVRGSLIWNRVRFEGP